MKKSKNAKILLPRIKQALNLKMCLIQFAYNDLKVVITWSTELAVKFGQTLC